MARILLIDDEELVRSTVRMMLERAGHEVTDVGQGLTGLMRFKQDGADLVVVRADMTAATGITVAESIRETDRHVPILLTGDPHGRGRLSGVNPERLGAQVIEPPFASDEVTGVVDQLLAAHS